VKNKNGEALNTLMLSNAKNNNFDVNPHVNASKKHRITVIFYIKIIINDEFCTTQEPAI